MIYVVSIGTDLDSDQDTDSVKEVRDNIGCSQEEKGEHLEEYAHGIVRAGFNQLICRERTLSASSIK
jgi:hypothetical protein